MNAQRAGENARRARARAGAANGGGKPGRGRHSGRGSCDSKRDEAAAGDPAGRDEAAMAAANEGAVMVANWAAEV